MFRLIIYFFLPLVILSIAVSGAEESQDLSRHPIYSKYKFGKDTKIIDFGTQPLAIPIGVIGEVIKRDRILARALKKKGWHIRFHPFLKGSDINYFLERGKIDATMAGDMPTIMTAASYDILVVALAKQSFSSIVAGKYMQISDLKGMTIAYPAGSTAHYALLVALSIAGMRESDVNMVPLDINEMPDALSQGRIDAFSAFEPVPSEALHKHPDFVVIQRFLNSSYFYFTQSFVKQNPDMAELATAAYVRALIWMKQDDVHLLKAAAWAIQAGQTLQNAPIELSIEQIAGITRNDILRIASLPVIPEKEYAAGGAAYKAFEFLKKQGKIPASAGWEKVLRSFNRDIINKVTANPERYGLLKFDYDN